jgi:hypothetical protein
MVAVHLMVAGVARVVLAVVMLELVQVVKQAALRAEAVEQEVMLYQAIL